MEDTSGDLLLDLLLPLLSSEDQANVSKHKTAALGSVASLRSSSLDTITGSNLENSHTHELDAITSKLSALALGSYPQLLASASSVDALLRQFSDFDKTSRNFYDSQFMYIDQEIHHYVEQSSSTDSERLGTAFRAPPPVAAKTHHRKRSNSVLSSITHGQDLLKEEQDEATAPQKNVEDAVVLLKNLEKVQDILELPNLIQACVNNGYYAEALDLAAHTARLSKRYIHVRVVQNIQAQVDDALKSMTVQLLQLLRESVKLPTLIKVVSYLRRIPPFSSRGPGLVTHQLQHLFFFSRLQYIRSLLESLEPLKRQSPDMYLKRYIELFREHVFVTVVGFRSVFPDTQLAGERAPVSRASDNLVAAFVRALVGDFHQTVTDIAPFIADDSARSSLWLQVLYCSKSLGRVGADFWPAWQGPELPEDNDDDDDDSTGPLSKKEWVAAIQKQMDISKHYLQTTGGVSVN